jgi:hypothetical protein
MSYCYNDILYDTYDCTKIIYNGKINPIDGIILYFCTILDNDYQWQLVLWCSGACESPKKFCEKYDKIPIVYYNFLLLT